MKIERKAIDGLNPAAYNPRKDLQPGDADYEKLKKSILEFDMVEPLIWNERTQNLVGGHQRLKVLKGLGWTEVEVSVVDLDELREKALNLALNKIQGDWNFPKLKDILEQIDIGEIDIEITGFDLTEIEDLMTQFHVPSEVPEKPKPIETLQLIPPDKIKAKIDEADHIVYLYSGGKDSGLAIAATIESMDKSKVRALFFDIGAEFPDLEYFIQQFCDGYSVPLDIFRPEKGWFEIFGKQKIFPDPVYRECIGKLMVEPQKEYLKQLGGETLLIYGGRRGQRVKRKQNSEYADFKEQRNLWAPLYDVKEGQIAEMLEGQPKWPGYSDGMVRTACWCCPFQRFEQWDAMKSRYKGLWEAMQLMAKTYKFKYHQQEITAVRRLHEYWGK